MAEFLLDTNVISEPLRPKPDPGVLEKLQLYQEELAISAITWHELWFGCLRLPVSVRKTTIERYLIDVVAPSLPILAYDERAAAWHAGERARLAGVGKTPSFVDGQIAAIACINDLTLVTFNTAHFLEFKDLRLEDWRSQR
jgi:tRNA(fMet)-specific endonuclease VapC